MPKVMGWWESRRTWACVVASMGERFEGGRLEGSE